MIGIVVSRADPASVHIGRQLRDLVEWTVDRDDDRPSADGGGEVLHRADFELRTFEGLHLELDGVAAAFDAPRMVVFASRHAGGTGPLLSAHFTGNLGRAEYGGRDREVATPCPLALARVLESLEAGAPDRYDVSMECTHHGPSHVGAPSMFVELGSGPDEWDDEEGARAVAAAILDLAGVEPFGDRRVVGFGGGHYAHRFTRIVRETPWNVGHVVADWGLEAMGTPSPDREPLASCFETSRTDLAVVEGVHPALERAIEDLGHRVVRETWLREVGDVDRRLVEQIEAELGPIEDGVRLGRGVRDHEGAVTVVDLPDRLLEEARSIDHEAIRAAVDEATLAYETVEGGTRVTGRAAVANSGAEAAIVEAAIEILSTRYEVEREPGSVVLHERAFDPERARSLGVPEGPAFGRLHAGEAVTVNGEEVRPEDVFVERTRRLPLDG